MCNNNLDRLDYIALILIGLIIIGEICDWYKTRQWRKEEKEFWRRHNGEFKEEDEGK